MWNIVILQQLVSSFQPSYVKRCLVILYNILQISFHANIIYTN